MTGSSLAPVVVPIVVTIALALWLGIVFYAAGHPEWKAHATRTLRVTGAEGQPETPGQAPRQQAVAAAAHGMDALEPGTAGDRRQVPSLPPSRAA
jgi:hypothetical protein